MDIMDYDMIRHDGDDKSYVNVSVYMCVGGILR